jgi:hypothetical protein
MILTKERDPRLITVRRGGPYKTEIITFSPCGRPIARCTYCLSSSKSNQRMTARDELSTWPAPGLEVRPQ